MKKKSYLLIVEHIFLFFGFTRSPPPSKSVVPLIKKQVNLRTSAKFNNYSKN